MRTLLALGLATSLGSGVLAQGLAAPNVGAWRPASTGR